MVGLVGFTINYVTSCRKIRHFTIMEDNYTHLRNFWGYKIRSTRVAITRVRNDRTMKAQIFGLMLKDWNRSVRRCRLEEYKKNGCIALIHKKGNVQV